MTADRNRHWTMREPQPAPWGVLAPAALRITWHCEQLCGVLQTQRLPAMELLERWQPRSASAFANGFHYTPARHDHELVLRAPAEEIAAALRDLTTYLRTTFPRARVTGLEIAAHAATDGDDESAADSLAVSEL